MNIDKNKLVSAREKALMNQFELSQASKVDLSLIRRLESIGGATPKSIAEKLAIALSTRLDDITTSEDIGQESTVEGGNLSDGGVAVSEQKAFLLVNTRRSLDQSPAPRLIRIDQITSMSVDFKEPKIWVIYETGSNGMTSTVTEYFKSFEVCRKLFPDVSLLPTSRCKKSHDGMAEALLMAEYARRRM